MKKVINGRMYNTETAKNVGYDSNGCNYTDFNFWRVTLFQNKNGEFFQFCEGGPRSPYGESSEGGRCLAWGERIVPITEEEARKWAEKSLDGDEYEAIFGEVSEGERVEDKKVRLTVDHENNAEQWWDGGGRELWKTISRDEWLTTVVVTKELAEEFLKKAALIEGWDTGMPHAKYPVVLNEED